MAMLCITSLQLMSHNYHPNQPPHSAPHMDAPTQHITQDLEAAGLGCLDSVVLSISFSCYAKHVPTSARNAPPLRRLYISYQSKLFMQLSKMHVLLVREDKH